MSRKAHKPKMNPGLPLLDIVQLAEFGDLYNDRAFTLANLLHHAAYLETIEDRLPKQLRYMVSYHRGVAWRLLSKVILEAWKKDDGSFFRSMADAIDHHRKPIDPIQAFVATQVGAAEAFGIPIPTIPKLQAGLRGLGFPEDQISRRQIYRIYTEYLGRIPPPAPRGRTCKTKA
jgi:hypothetical protein